MKELQQQKCTWEHCTKCRTQQEMSSSDALKPLVDADGHGRAMLLALGQHLDAHLDSLVMLQGASATLTVQCRDTVLEIAKLLEAIHQYQVSYAQVLTEAQLLRRIIADFARFVHANGIHH